MFGPFEPVHRAHISLHILLIDLSFVVSVVFPVVFAVASVGVADQFPVDLLRQSVRLKERVRKVRLVNKKSPSKVSLPKKSRALQK